MKCRGQDHKENPVEKFYDERKLSDDGNVIEEYDATGENSTKYVYADRRDLISRIKAPNGQTVSFGRDPHTDGILGISAVVDDEKNYTVSGFSKGFLRTMDCGNTKIEYSYDEKGRRDSVSVNGKEHVSFAYGEENDNNIVAASYGNGEGYETVSDVFGKVIEVRHTDVNGKRRAVLQNRYDKEDRLIRTVDLVAKEAMNIVYDDSGNIIKQVCGDVEILPRYTVEKDKHTALYRIGVYAGDNNGGLERTTKEQSYTNRYDDDGTLKAVELPTGDRISVYSDGLGRRTRTEGPAGTAEYGYLQRDDHATNTVNRMIRKNADGTTDRIKYFYDANGSIKEIRNSGKLVSRYRYDGLNRLIREDNAGLGRTETYEYDGNGNILFRDTYNLSLSEVLANGRRTEYVYDGDRLMCLCPETANMAMRSRRRSD